MVGRSLIKFYNKKQFEILTPSSSSLDLLEKNSIDDYLNKNKPTFIVHLAGHIGGIGASVNEPINFLQENILMGINLIKSSYQFKIKNFINLGSSCIYPPNLKKPIKENQLLDGKIEKTNEGYALAKISTIKLCEYISLNKNYNYLSLIPCNIYGPHDKFDEIRGHLIGSLIKKIYDAKLKRKKNVELWGTGNPKREFIYVDDVSKSIIKFMSLKNITNKKIYWVNIGSGNEIKVKEIAKKIAELVNYNCNFKFNLNKPDGVKTKLMNISLAKKLGWKPETNLNNGLKKTLKWYQNNIH